MTIATPSYVSVKIASAPRSGRWLLITAVLMVVLGQRLAVPFGAEGQVAFTVVGMLAVALVGLLLGALVIDRTRARLLGIALVVIAIVSTWQFVRGLDASLLSLILIFVIYLPAVTVASSPADARGALQFFVDLMLVFAGLGLFLFALQYTGVGYRDYVAEALPAQIVQQGYNTAYPLTYGSDIYRSNGVVFLEPSIFSLFLAVAIVVSLYLSHRRRGLMVLVAALACTASGNGIVVLVTSLGVMLLLESERKKLRNLLVPLLLGAVLLVVTPLGALLVARSTELDAPTSSASLRIVAPYQVLAPTFVSSTWSTVAGNGAGSTQVYYESFVLDAYGDPAILTPPPAKLLFEFGLVGGLAFMAFLLHMFLVDGRRVPWAFGMLLGFFVINASLQQPTIAAGTYLLLSILGVVARVSIASTPHLKASPASIDL